MNDNSTRVFHFWIDTVDPEFSGFLSTIKQQIRVKMPSDLTRLV